MYYPPDDVLASWVMVSPMNEPAFFVPDILTVKANAVAYLKPGDSWGDVDVV